MSQAGLKNKRQLTRGTGDILIQIKVKDEKMAVGVLEINDGSFEDEVLRCNSPVVVDF